MESPFKQKYFWLLLALVGWLFCHPLLESGLLVSSAFSLVLSLILLVTLYSMQSEQNPRRPSRLSMLLGLPALAAVWWHYFDDSPLAETIEFACLIPFFLAAVRSIYRHVLYSPRVTYDEIRGALCLYLLLGLVWAAAYRIVVLWIPDAFSGLDQHPSGWHSLIYFSFVTLATLGYGDITPAHPLARMLSTTEAMIGTFFVAVVVAKVVALHLRHQEDPKNNKSV
jgi:hypothetical protein